MRNDISFNDIIYFYPQTSNFLFKCRLLSKANQLYEKYYWQLKETSQGNKPSTISREALRMVVNQLGVNLI